VANPRYAGLARKTQAAAVLVEPGFQEISAATLRIQQPLPGLLAGPGALLSAPGLCSRHSPHGSHRSRRPKLARAPTLAPTSWSGRGASGNPRHAAASCGALPRRQAGEPSVRPRPCRGARELHSRRPRDLENGAIVGSDGFGFAKTSKAIGRRFRNPARSGWATASMSRPTPASTARRWGPRKSATAAKSTTWSRSATAPKWAKTP
jgi:UDP-3-O-[3-hydroxymyristoyl] glucosamine N-acyltransferase